MAPAQAQALGFRMADSGPHPSKTLMLHELEALLAAVPAGAPAKAYRAAIVERNVLGKRALSTRQETASRLTALPGLKADLRRESISGLSVATAPQPIDDGGARLLVEDDDLEGAVVMAVLISPDGRVVAQRGTVVGGEA